MRLGGGWIEGGRNVVGRGKKVGGMKTRGLEHEDNPKDMEDKDTDEDVGGKKYLTVDLLRNKLCISSPNPFSIGLPSTPPFLKFYRTENMV